MTRLAPELLARLRSRSARRWYPGGAFGAIYIVISLWAVWTSPDEPLWLAALATAVLLALAVAFVLTPPLIWGRSPLVVNLAMLAYTGLVCLSFPFLGYYTVWLFIYAGCFAAGVFAQGWNAIAWIAGIAMVQLGLLLASGLIADNWYAVMLSVSISCMLLGITQLSRSNVQLRDAQGEIARLAVVEERSRFSRDMHDVLGHSLTVVTVKSELAARLVELDPERAKSELADIERLTRAALADLRASVAGYREMSLDTEFAAARAALAAAEVQASVPVSGAAADPALRELFAWTVREAVTNVIRHAQAAHCAIELHAEALRVTDDGVGVQSGRGTGLAGLAERAAAAGAVLTVAAGERRGTIVTVARAGSVVGTAAADASAVDATAADAAAGASAGASADARPGLPDAVGMARRSAPQAAAQAALEPDARSRPARGAGPESLGTVRG